jgi:predicted transcriptional regulator
MKVLLSIKPQYANKILNWEKLFELRKSIPKDRFDTVVVYSSSPEKRIIWEFSVDKIIHERIDTLRNIVKDKACVDKRFFDEYYKWRDKWYAIKIKEVKRYEKSLPITVYSKYPPQGFMYIG